MSKTIDLFPEAAPYRMGFTEAGDAGIDLSWRTKLDEVVGAVLITKNVNDEFIDAVLDEIKNNHRKIIVHATCTGWGSTVIEPGVPAARVQLDNTLKLIEEGFDADKIVLRIDPIFPNAKGVSRALAVLAYAKEIGLLAKPIRVRISIYDEYQHVRERCIKRGWQPIYNDERALVRTRGQANEHEMKFVYENLKTHFPDVTFYTCAEPHLLGDGIDHAGCLSNQDYEILGLDAPPTAGNVGKQRPGACMCLGYKKELLRKPQRCKHGCIYCYWR